MKKTIIISSIILTLSGCGTTQIKEGFFGLSKKEYIEPTTTETASLTVNAPLLKTQMLLTDKIRISLYNSCTDQTGFRSEGYIGGFDLTSKTIKTKTVAIDTQKPLFVEVGYDQKNFQCTNKFRILPESSSEYIINWKFDRLACYATGKKLVNNKPTESDEIVQKNNKTGFFSGGSGRSTSEWRNCKNKDH